MRLGKVQASGYVADVAEEEVTPEPLASATSEPVAASGREAEREQVTITG
ncbi:MAG: hypothetical protein FWE35_00455 [Streptosporangiales bacterium]|jgi:hypothetical protein|nr:hypothetical protein [Streptosporangiales bacterium]